MLFQVTFSLTPNQNEINLYFFFIYEVEIRVRNYVDRVEDIMHPSSFVVLAR